MRVLKAMLWGSRSGEVDDDSETLKNCDDKKQVEISILLHLCTCEEIARDEAGNLCLLLL